jgi:hypothetical protein
MTTAVEFLASVLSQSGPITEDDFNSLVEQAKEMEQEKQGKFTIDFINWLHLNQYKYNPKAKFYQKHFINETLFFSIDELFIAFKQQDNEELN